MIASLRGNVLEVSLTGAVIEVGGVGMAFQATPATLAGLRAGEEGFVRTELVVREDALTLYGFADADERHCFRVLLGAKGVGAKLALAILAVHTPDALRRAVAADDVAALRRVPGLGPKGAQRVMIDVADKLGPPSGDGPAADAGTAPPDEGAANPDVVAALVQLGWNEAVATRAVASAEAAHRDEAHAHSLLPLQEAAPGAPAAAGEADRRIRLVGGLDTILCSGRGLRSVLLALARHGTGGRGRGRLLAGLETGRTGAERGPVVGRENRGGDTGGVGLDHRDAARTRHQCRPGHRGQHEHDVRREHGPAVQRRVAL